MLEEPAVNLPPEPGEVAEPLPIDDAIQDYPTEINDEEDDA